METIPPLLEYETRRVLINLKIEIAPDPNKIENKYLKLFNQVLTKPLTLLFNKILDSGYITTPLEIGRNNPFTQKKW